VDCIYHKVTQILWKWTLYNNKSNRDILNIIRCKLLEASFRKGITTPLIFTPDTNLFASACIYLSSFPNGVNSYEIEPRRVSAFAHASSDRRRAWPTPIHNKAKGGGGIFRENRDSNLGIRPINHYTNSFSKEAKLCNKLCKTKGAPNWLGSNFRKVCYRMPRANFCACSTRGQYFAPFFQMSLFFPVFYNKWHPLRTCRSFTLRIAVFVKPPNFRLNFTCFRNGQRKNLVLNVYLPVFDTNVKRVQLAV